MKPTGDWIIRIAQEIIDRNGKRRSLIVASEVRAILEASRVPAGHQDRSVETDDHDQQA